MQKSVLEFGTHPLGSVLCKRKRCSVKKEDSKGSSVTEIVRESEKHSQNSLSQERKSFSLLSSLHRSNLGKCVQDFYANLENILKIR